MNTRRLLIAIAATAICMTSISAHAQGLVEARWITKIDFKKVNRQPAALDPHNCQYRLHIVLPGMFPPETNVDIYYPLLSYAFPESFNKTNIFMKFAATTSDITENFQGHVAPYINGMPTLSELVYTRNRDFPPIHASFTFQNQPFSYPLDSKDKKLVVQVPISFANRPTGAVLPFTGEEPYSLYGTEQLQLEEKCSLQYSAAPPAPSLRFDYDKSGCVDGYDVLYYKRHGDPNLPNALEGLKLITQNLGTCLGGRDSTSPQQSPQQQTQQQQAQQHRR